MLRVEIHDSVNTLGLKFEGRFTGDDAQNTCTVIRHCFDGMRILVDLTEVTFIDSAGEEVLSLFGRFGAEFVAETSYTLDVCERLKLRVVRPGASKAKTSDTHPTGADGAGLPLIRRKVSESE